MKTIAFVLSVLSAAVAAHQTQVPTSDAEDNGLFGGIKLWNCGTCTMAFNGLDRFLDSDTFKNPVKKAAIGICGLVPIIKDEEVCPDAVNHYSPVLFESMSSHLLAKNRWCNEILGVCTHMKVEQEDLH